MLVLLGPFVDVEHPMVKTGNLPLTYNELFRDVVRCQFKPRPAVAWAAIVCSVFAEHTALHELSQQPGCMLSCLLNKAVRLPPCL